MNAQDRTFPSRRGLLRLASATAAAAPAVLAVAPGATPAGVSPDLAAAVARYWACVDTANAPEADDDVTDAMCIEANEAASSLAGVPCRGVADLAAKIAFVVGVMTEQNAWGHLTSAEGEVILSLKQDAATLAGPEAPAPVPRRSAPAADPDAALLALCVQWERAIARNAEVVGRLACRLECDWTPAECAEWDASHALADALQDSVTETRAATVAGVRAKASVLRRMAELDGIPCPEECAASLVADLTGLPA